AWLFDAQRHVHVLDLRAPGGWPGAQDFPSTLAEALTRLHRDAREPVDQSLRRGSQTLGNLFSQADPLVDALRRSIAEAIDGVLADWPRDAAHPWFGRRTGSWRFTDSWSSRLVEDGFHTNHIHPHGWISAVYYVQVPAACADEQSRSGWLRFGVADFLGAAQVPAREVQPRPGRLVLFPSYMWHGTRPNRSSDARLTVAFDLVPV
ncbi:MAG: putative 2OG-Fe(II) oxygenase, partial [Rubrivivax sp.]